MVKFKVFLRSGGQKFGTTMTPYLRLLRSSKAKIQSIFTSIQVKHDKILRCSEQPRYNFRKVQSDLLRTRYNFGKVRSDLHEARCNSRKVRSDLHQARYNFRKIQSDLHRAKYNFKKFNQTYTKLVIISEKFDQTSPSQV